MAIYASSDWHGNLTIAKQILDYLQPDDTLYFLGDAIDRGPDGWEILKLLLNDPRVVFLAGNHEDMMLKALSKPLCEENADDLDLWLYNGAEPTLAAYVEDDIVVRAQILEKVASAPLQVQLTTAAGKIFLNHSGFYSSEEPEYIEKHLRHQYLWNRTHLEYTDYWYKYPKNAIVIFGHTPVQVALTRYLGKEEKTEVLSLKYGDKRKIDIDMGTHFSKTSVLLNLDTLEEKYFYDLPQKKKKKNKKKKGE